ncbi:MAG: hypothetical protein ACKPKO_29535, partial [Candidatus Fonsibacter sp.]
VNLGWDLPVGRNCLRFPVGLWDMPSGMNRLAFVSLDPPRCRMVPSDVLQAATGFQKTVKLENYSPVVLDFIGLPR